MRKYENFDTENTGTDLTTGLKIVQLSSGLEF